MAARVTADMVDPDTPPSVIVTAEPRVPEFDPTLGIAVAPPTAPGTPLNKLVTLGDSLTHGFQSGAIFNTDLSWPAVVAWEAGVYETFRRPHYPGFGGLPLNIELLVRDLEARFGDRIRWYDAALALFAIRQHLGEVVDYWEHGAGAIVPPARSIMHDLAVFGFDLRDALELTAERCAQTIATTHDSIIAPIVGHAKERAALRVFPYTPDASGTDTVLGAAAVLGAQGTRETPGSGHGIETLVVFLGANNALRSVTQLQVKWSQAGYDQLGAKDAFTVWDPDHFALEYDALVTQVQKIRARNVIVTTVPHVTIAPVARGVGVKVRPGSRYFPYYTRPWISDQDFDVSRDPHVTENQARAIDSAIDQYNDQIAGHVRAARNAGRNWFLLDVAGLLDRLAARRYQADPAARPAWWTPYPLPPDIAALAPPIDSRFFASDDGGRIQGGLFSLDGVHPTTIAYGIIAQEMITVMQRAGVRFYGANGTVERTGPVLVDFKRLLVADTLVADPPKSLSSDLGTIGWINAKADLVRRLFG